MASQNQLDAIESQVKALSRDFVTQSRQVEAISSQLQHLENKDYPTAATGRLPLQSLHHEQHENIFKRLHALEAASARRSTMLQDVAATSDRLAQLALSSEARVLKEMRNPAGALVQEVDGPTGHFVDPQEISKRLSILEERISQVVEDIVAQGRSITSLRDSDRFLLLEQSISAMHSQIQQSDQNRVENSCTTLETSAAGGSHSLSTGLGTQAALAARRASIDDLEYEFRGSIWDLSLFIGTDILTPATSLVVGLGFFLNVALLICFIDMCLSLGTAEFDEESRDHFHVWRTSVAHNIEFRNSITGESLAHGVCTERLYTPIATYQLNTVQRLRDYLGDHPILRLGIPKGMWMCWLSMCVWYMTVTVELREIIEVIAVFANVPILRHTGFDQSKEQQHKVHLVAISRFRALFLAGVLWIRFGVMVILGYQGTLLLIYEISVQDMILNSVALQVMLNFDEMMFASMVPSVPQEAIRLVMPLKRGRISNRRWRKWLNRTGLFVMILLLYTMLFISFHMLRLQPFVNDLQENLDALCGEMSNLNFVVAVDAIGIPWAAPTSGADTVKEIYAFKAIDHVLKTGFQVETLQPTQRSNSGWMMQVDSGNTLQNLRVDLPEFGYPKDWSMVDPYALPDVVGWVDEFLVLGSKDFGDVPGTVYNHYLEFLLGVQGVNCSHVPFENCVRQGSATEDVVYRQLCPNRCGCALPMTGTASNPYSANSGYGFLGCSSWNTRKKTFVDTLDNLPCTDTTSRDVFVSWAEGLGSSQNSTGGDLFTSIVAAFDYGGCGASSYIKLGEMDTSRVCAATSLPAICPFSCGCYANASWTVTHTLRMEFCPSSCQRQEPICVTVEKHHDSETGDRGPFHGFACVFPFIYKGEVFDNCTTTDWSGLWCSIGMRDGASYRWGDCPDRSACRRSGVQLT